MEFVVDPKWFYFIQLCKNLSIIFILVSIVGWVVSFMTYSYVFCFERNSILRDYTGKVLLALSFCTLMAAVIPSEETATKCMVSAHLTPEIYKHAEADPATVIDQISKQIIENTRSKKAVQD